MVEPAEEQKELAEKLKILDENIKILWSGKGLVTLIDGLITIPVTKDIDESIRHFLMEYSALFGFKKDLSDLKFITKTYSLNTYHIRYQQFYEEIPVLYAFISVHLNEESKIIMVKNNYHPEIALDTKAILNGGISKEKAIEIVHLDLNAETRLKRDSTVDLVILPIEDEFYLTWEVSVALKNPSEGHHIYVDVRHGEIIKKMGVFRRKTIGKGRVFIPNPVVALRHLNLTPESDITEDAYTTVVLKGLDGSGFLRGEYVDTVNTPSRAYEPSHLFYYKRGDSRFCEVMAYYHIDSCQRFIQELGFKNICNKQIKVNAYAEERGSYFDCDTKDITFGAIGIPDAEDADIIIHEYAHAIMDDQVSFLSLTEEGGAMEQGFGDFLAACFFAEESAGFNREAVGDWNGIGNVLRCVRRVDSQKYYPENFLGVISCDADGEIWSSALWDLYLTLGGNSEEKDNRIKARERSIRLVLESHFFLNPLSKFIDGAEAIITANKILYSGRDEEKIKGVLIKRGFL
ncbi:Zinc metalloprotease (elastase) [Candidatus Methanoperedens nitroreducens]|uniref:Zinc metalloprotease (Elastase) n=1 Tax=Candidatus Methanoperedens nitratireducens TaxID=1392998 RepID=A0A062V3D7_9EURY|nr:M36 family metallopeptidase [Candidatus Methanoperedens nitroreducens]KCZ70334.1 Zinc metalloprotease (elastase) [Candidatus Methanoperedens nitroreducens]MDJ1421372.1 M36 family metallopeptidase [Candidatus Methanoperedens sp.]